MGVNKSSHISNKDKQDRKARLAQALRKNLRRRKAPQTPVSSLPARPRKDR